MAQYRLSDKERERRKQLARELHSQVDPTTGRRKFGGPQPGSGRPRKARAAELVAEEAQKKASKIAKVYDDAIADTQPIQVRLAGAKDWIAIENRESELQLKEERDLREMNHDELLDKVALKLMGLAQGGHLDESMSKMLGMPVQGGDVVELGPDDYEMMNGNGDQAD